MDKRKIVQLEKQVKAKTEKTDFPPPGFFKVGDPLIDSYREDLLKQGYSLEVVNRTPIFIEEG